MACTLKIVTHAPNDFHVLGDYPFSVGAACYGVGNKVNFIVHQGGNILSSSYAKVATDRSLRVPSDNHTVRVRGINPGYYTVQATASSESGRVVSNSANIRVFPKAEVVIKVGDQTQLSGALVTALAEPDKHVKLILSSGNYTWDLDISSRDGLLSVEADRGALVTMNSSFGSSYKSKWTYWYGVSFYHSSNACYSAASTQRVVFEKCRFFGAFTGVICEAGSGVRMEECHLASLTDGLVNVSVVRSCTWETVSRIVANNCSVVDGLFGARTLILGSQSVASDTLRVVSLTSAPATGAVIRNVSSIEDFGKLITLSNGTYTNVAIVGNTISSSDSGGLLTLAGLSNSVIANNSLRSTAAIKTSTVVATGSVSNCIIQDNWVSSVDKSVSRFAGQPVFAANFVGESPVSTLPVQFIVASNPFDNSFLFPSESSVLRYSASSIDIGVKTVQGLARDSNSGALPFRRSQDVTSAYDSMRVNPYFSYTGPTVESI